LTGLSVAVELCRCTDLEVVCETLKKNINSLCNDMERLVKEIDYAQECINKTQKLEKKASLQKNVVSQ